MVLEGLENILQFIGCFRHVEFQIIKPFLIDETHIPDCLDGGLVLTELLNPGKRPDMTFGIRAHLSVFRIFIEDFLQVRHVFVDVILKRKNQLLLSVFQKVAVAEAGGKDEIRES